MSASAMPISPAAFATAIRDLPLSNLHAKAAELRNSIAHLHSSNTQLQPFADEGDEECLLALRENAEVMSRMEGRIQLLKAEVEGRGMLWSDPGAIDEPMGSRERRDGHPEMTGGVNGHVDSQDRTSLGRLGHGHAAENAQRQTLHIATSTDGETPATRAVDGEDEDGMHL
ncbi:MAG: hypothetical protein M1833_006156 [Piccolia ochrophora]|nr:MAG: hypothetical protein M1833_006156 [Piccolia ochrophora]